MKLQLKKSETSVILVVFIQDSSSTTGAGLGSLIHTSSIVGGYIKRGSTGVALTVDEDVATEGTYQAPSTAANVRIGTPANMTAGVYELHFHNDLFTTADYVVISLSGAANMAPLLIEVQLTNIDLNTNLVDDIWGHVPNTSAVAYGSMEDKIIDNTDVLANQAGPSLTMTDATIDSAGFAPTTTQFESSDITEPLTNHYEGRVIIFKTGDLAKAASNITAYSLSGGRGQFTVAALPQAPANGDEFSIV